RPMSTAVTTIPAEDDRIDLEPIRRIIRDAPEGADRLTRVLYAANAAYGYLPWGAAEMIAAEFGKTMTDLYTTGSLLANFRGAPARASDRPVEELLELIEKSNLRGRGGAGYPFVDKLRAVRRNADGGPVYLVANAYDADPGSPLSRALLTRNAEGVLVGIAIA